MTFGSNEVLNDSTSCFKKLASRRTTARWKIALTVPKDVALEMILLQPSSVVMSSVVVSIVAP